MYECRKAKNNDRFYLFIYLPPQPSAHSPHPESFSFYCCFTLRGHVLKIEVFPMHVLELFSSASNPVSPSSPLPLRALYPLRCSHVSHEYKRSNTQLAAKFILPHGQKVII